MSTLGELLAEHTVLPGGAVDHLHAVVGEWQLLADLSFGDFLMWVRRDDGALVCVAQCRPNTAATVLITDAVGTVVGEEALLGAVPVRYHDDVVALLTVQSAADGRHTSSPLEKAYLDCAGHLLAMVSEGTFPNVADLALSRSSPRVGDGFIRLDVDGVVTYASPNALSAYHRMGLTAELEGHNLIAITRPLLSDPFEARELADHIGASLACGSGMRLELDAGGAAVLLRTLPLCVGGNPAGAAVLIRDVTEVKRRDRALLSKDATIREIHHRVKNNLQTVAALLRLQARRTTNAEGPIWDRTLAELRELDAGYRFTRDGLAFPFRGQGVRIPTLEEVLELDPAARVNLEIKQAEPAMVEALWQRIRELGVEDRVLVASEDHRLVQAFRRVAGGAVATSAGKLEIFAFWLGSRAGLSRWLPIDYDALQVPVRFAGLEVVNARFVEAAHQNGLQVHVWTIDDVEQMRWLIELGVDGIMTDEPARLAELARARGLMPDTGIGRGDAPGAEPPPRST